MKVQTMANVVPIYVAPIPSLVASKQYWSYLCRNFKFHDGTSKIYAIIFYGNALVYNYNY